MVVVVVLQGGIGNQMFQYAVARVLSIKLDTDVVIDLSFFSIHGQKKWCRPYELDVFNYDSFNKKHLNIFTRSKLLVHAFPFLIKSTVGLFLLEKMNVINDKTFYRVDSLYNGNKTIKLFGYFLHEKYFRPYRQEIIDTFSFKPILCHKNQSFMNKILKLNSVSVHIRRGDFILNENAKKIYPIVPVDWYKTAIAEISIKVYNPTFFFFSDDMEWVKKNFGEIGNTYFVDINGRAELAHNDMRLMSLCKHNIIANSSFSWWGAWLNTNPDKIVIAPKQFYRNKGANDKIIRDLMPEDWTLM